MYVTIGNSVREYHSRKNSSKTNNKIILGIGGEWNVRFILTILVLQK